MIARGLVLAAFASLLIGCSASTLSMLGDFAPGAASARPAVRASDGANATLSVTACPPGDRRATALSDTLTTLAQQGELVSATSQGTARLYVNVCPDGAYLAPPPLPTRSR